jgi:CxxC motif-containing protein (DUF1111 family)
VIAMRAHAGGMLALLVGAATLAAAVTVALGAQSGPRPGDPLPGVTPREFEEFRLGLEEFREVEAAEEGLGPIFNAAGCALCHSVPVVGGGSSVTEVRAGARDADGTFRLVGDGTLFQLFSIPDHRCQSIVPPEANVVARRLTPPLFGAGLIEAIPDETLLALDDPFDRDRDLISGRAAIVLDLASRQRRVGRFGWKAQHATLLAFAADAYANEMGITNDLFPHEPATGVPASRMAECDRVRDPEDLVDPRTGRRGIDGFEAFMRFLAPLARGPLTDEVRAGEQVFGAIGCAACHVPALMTGANRSAALHRQPVPLYSDLLLHDVGTGDGIAQDAALPEEIRTPALWGLGRRRPLLHDGSAATADEAIRRHAGEAAVVLARYRALTDAARRALLAFLASL